MERGTLGLIFAKAKNKFQDPAKLRRADLDEFVALYKVGKRHERAETWHAYGYDELTCPRGQWRSIRRQVLHESLAHPADVAAQRVQLVGVRQGHLDVLNRGF
jgi:hypothetical protein